LETVFSVGSAKRLYNEDPRPARYYTFSIDLILPEDEADHSPPTSAAVKNTWIYTSTPSYAFMA
jgi:hypothetical protein